MPINHIAIKSDGVLEQVAENMQQAPSWMPKLIRKEIKRLGPRAVRSMQGFTARNYYTGALTKSVKAEYKDDGHTVQVGPTAMRGRWDAGLILEFGTRPIARCPYAPIKAWADVKGAPMPGAWLKIRTSGVSPHPFLDDTLDGIQDDLDKTRDNIVGGMVAAALHGTQP